MKIKKVLSGIAAAVLMAGMVSGCGASNEGDNGGSAASGWKNKPLF